MKKQNTLTPEAKDGKYMCSECDTMYDNLNTGCPHCNKLEKEHPATPVNREGEEESVIGDLKDKFRRADIKNQQKAKFSVSEILGAISLAYYRGKQSSPLTEDELKSKYAQHLGVEDLDTSDAKAVEWTVGQLCS